MATILEIAIYAVAAGIAVAVLATLAALVLFPRSKDEGADEWELQPMGEASSYRREK